MESSVSSSNFRRLRNGFGDWIQSAATWWTAELSALLPQRTANWLLDVGVRSLVLANGGKDVDLLLRDQGGRILRKASVPTGEGLPAAIERFLSAHRLDRRDISLGLQLPPECFFIRQLTLPREVGRSVRAVALRDLLRKTPLREEEIHHACMAQRSGDRIQVTQMVVRRKFVEEAAADLGLEPGALAFVEIAQPTVSTGAPCVVDLYERRANSRWLPRLFLGLMALFVGLAMTGAVLRYAQQQTKLDDLALRSEAARAQAQENRTRIDAAKLQIATANQLRSRKRAGVKLLQIWEELSRILPADSWVTELRLSKGEKATLKVTLTGFSPAAANLVGIIDRSSLFSSVALTAPIALDPVEQRERFSLQATVDELPAELARR